MKPLVLFDVDGTLLLTSGAGMRAMRRSLRSLFERELVWDGVVVSGHLDPLIFAEVAERNGIDADASTHRRFRDAYLEALADEIARNRDTVYALPGVLELLAQLRETDQAALGLLTGNYTPAIPLKLRAVEIDPAWFSVGAFGDEAPSRPDMAALAIRRYEEALGRPARRESIVIVGDTPRDVECALVNGCVPFGVATGRYSTDELRTAGARRAVPDLTDPAPLLELLGELHREAPAPLRGEEP